MRTILKFVLIIILCLSPLMVLNGENINDLSNDKTFDSIDNAINTTLKKGDKVSAIKLMNSKGKLLFSQGLYASEIVLLLNAIKLSDDGKDTIKHAEIKELYMESLNAMGAAYSYVAQYGDAISCYIKMDKYNRGNNILYKTKFYNGMGVVFSMSSKHKQANEYYLQALSVVNKIDNEQERQLNLFAINVNLGGLLLNKNSYDSAHIHIMEAHKYAVLMKDRSRELVCMQLLGALNGRTGNYGLAINYYNKACDIALERKDYYMVPFLKSNISDMYIDMKDYDAAFSTAYEGLEIARRFNMKKLEMTILGNLSQIYKQTGDSDKALYYIEESNKIRDSLFSQDNEERFLRQKTDFDMYKISIEKEIFDKNIEIQDGRRIINNMIVAIVILILSLTLVFLTRKLFKQEREHKALNEQHNLDINTYIDKQKGFEDEIEKKNRELFLSSLSTAKSNELSALLMQKLKILKTNLPSRSKGQETIKEAEELVLELTKDSYVGEVNDCLKHVPSDFYDKLEMRYPDLTPGEKKMCALMSFGLSSRDIANMTGKTNGAVRNVKFRIRQKTNIDIEVDLEDFMFHIRES